MTETADAARREWVRHWLFKDESDLITACQLLSHDDPRLDTAIYHCQQSSEKAIKAFLAHSDLPIEQTHDIARLVCTASKLNQTFDELHACAELLTPFATAFRVRQRHRN